VSEPNFRPFLAILRDRWRGTSLDEASNELERLLRMFPAGAALPVPALSDEGIEWLLARIEETRTSYNEVLARHPNDPILRELRWAIGHATLAGYIIHKVWAGPPSDFCGEDFMAGELCTRHKGHEGPHVGG